MSRKVGKTTKTERRFTRRPIPTTPHTINVRRDVELKYWTSVLSITESQLCEAVRQAGPSVKDVRQWLRNKRKAKTQK